MNPTSQNLLLVIIMVSLVGCPAKYREDLNYSYGVEQTLSLDEFPSHALVQFESVSWDPENYVELRTLIGDDKIAAGRNVLEIGTGTGVIAALCLSYGAKRVVATDTNPAAIANAIYNAATLELDSQLDARQIGSGDADPFAVIRSNERFGLIIVHATSESETVADRSAIDLVLEQLREHQQSGGRCIVSCNDRKRIKLWWSGSAQREYEFRMLKDRVVGERDLETMNSQVFPAALLEIRVPIDQLGEIE